jgi:cytochrome c oxidase assembly protein subunit 11
MPDSQDDEDIGLKADNRRMGLKLVVIAAVMVGFGYAMVPMYKSICEALGINVLSRSETDGTRVGERGPVNTQVDKARTVSIELDANARGPWSFKPAVTHVDVHPGEITTVMYEFRNQQDRTMTAQAIPSYAPKQATAHFNKLECFCFRQYTLAPGESKQWPVVFVVDDKLPKDVKTITLSYTFFEVPGTAKTAQAPAPQAAVQGRAS